MKQLFTKEERRNIYLNLAKDFEDAYYHDKKSLLKDYFSGICVMLEKIIVKKTTKYTSWIEITYEVLFHEFPELYFISKPNMQPETGHVWRTLWWVDENTDDEWEEGDDDITFAHNRWIQNATNRAFALCLMAQLVDEEPIPYPTPYILPPNDGY